MELNLIKEEEYKDKGVTGLPDTPGLSTVEMQKKFDELSVDVLIPAFNRLVEALLPLEVVEGVQQNTVVDDETQLVTGAALCRFAEEVGIGGSGGGDMLKATYDQNRSGVVDDAEKLGGNAPDYYQPKTDETLVTSAKTVAGAINECFQCVSDGKQLLADTIADCLGKDVSANGAFEEFAGAIEDVRVGKGFQYGNHRPDVGSVDIMEDEAHSVNYHVYIGRETLSKEESAEGVWNDIDYYGRAEQDKLRVYTTLGERNIKHETWQIDASEGAQYYRYSPSNEAYAVYQWETGRYQEVDPMPVSVTPDGTEISCYRFRQNEDGDIYYFPTDAFSIISDGGCHVRNVVASVEITTTTYSTADFGYLQMIGMREFLLIYRLYTSAKVPYKTMARMGRVSNGGAISLGAELELAAAWSSTVAYNAYLMAAINSTIFPTQFLVLRTEQTLSTGKVAMKYTRMWCNVSTLALSRDTSNSATKWSTIGTYPDMTFAFNPQIDEDVETRIGWPSPDSYLAYVWHESGGSEKVITLFDNTVGVKTLTKAATQVLANGLKIINTLLPNGKVHGGDPEDATPFDIENGLFVSQENQATTDTDA